MVENATIEVAKNITGNESFGSALIYIADKLGIGLTQLATIYAQVQAELAVIAYVTSLGFWVALGITTILFWFRYVPKTVNRIIEINKEGNTLDKWKDEDKRKLEELNNEETMKIIALFAYGGLWVFIPFLVDALIGGAGDVYMHWQHPDYYAIQQIIQQFQAMK